MKTIWHNTLCNSTNKNNLYKLTNKKNL